MPVIIALALVLGGGGFFMTKKKAPDVHAVEQSEESTSLGEMTINLKDSSTYVKFEMVVVARKDYPKELIDKNVDTIRDYLNGKIPEYSLKDFQTAAGKSGVKKVICAGLNELLPLDPKAAEASALSSKKTKKHKLAAEVSDEPTDEQGGEAAHWNSQTGPILRVMFRTFAWQ